jgi:hypothetical protein
MITDDNEIVPTVFYWMPNLLILSPKPLREKVEKLAALFIEKMRVAQQ